MAQQSTAPATFRKATRIPVGRDQLLNTIELLIDPLTLSVSLWVLTLLFEGYLAPRYVILSLIVFSLTFPGATYLNKTPWRLLRGVLLGWLVVGGCCLRLPTAAVISATLKWNCC